MAASLWQHPELQHQLERLGFGDEVIHAKETLKLLTRCEEQLSHLSVLFQQNYVRYERAVREQRHSFCLMLRMKQMVIQSVRSLFKQYIAEKKCELRVLLDDLQRRGILLTPAEQ